jgi:hypothetical protein
MAIDIYKGLRLRTAVIPPLAKAEGSPDRDFMEFCGLRDNDIRWLLETQTETLPARDFTVSLISEPADNPAA